jgi:hypothetical protein
MKDSEAADLTLNAYKRMLKRGIITIPKASMTTDGASSFKSVFDDFLEENGVHHRTTRAGRHRQMANVDNLCRQLGDLFNGVMNTQEKKTGKRSRAWTKHIDTIRMQLNRFRTKPMPKDVSTLQYPMFDPTKSNTHELPDHTIDMKKLGLKEKKYKHIEPKYKIGDTVNIMLFEPLDALGNKQSTKNFRMGDYRASTERYTVVQIVYYAGTPSYRYLLEAQVGASAKVKKRVKDVSFEENEMKQL